MLLGVAPDSDLDGQRARAFASAGFVATTVVYYGVPGTQRSLWSVPVETIGRVLSDLKSRADVDPMKIAILGSDRGGEFAMLAASRYPDIHATVSNLGSPLSWGDGVVGDHAAWTYGGRELPFVSHRDLVRLKTDAYGSPDILRRPVAKKAFFPIERLNGPLLLFAVKKGDGWDSSSMATAAADYDRSPRSCYPATVVVFPKAGNTYLAASDPSVRADPLATPAFGPDLVYDFQSAARKAWKKIFSFLGDAFAHHGDARCALASQP